MASCSTSANEIVDDKSEKFSGGTSWDKSKNGNGKLFSQVFTGKGFRRASSKVNSDEGSSGENEGNGLSPTASNVSNDDLPRRDASDQPLKLTVDKITENVPKRTSDLNVLNRTSYTPSRRRQVIQKAENEVGYSAPNMRTAGRPKNERTGNRQQQLEQDQQSQRLRPRRSSKRPERFVAVPSKRGFGADEGDMLFLSSGDHAGIDNDKNTEFTGVEVKGKSNRGKCHTDIKGEVAESRPAMTVRSHGDAIKRNEQQRQDPISQTGRRRTRRSSKTPERYVARPSKQGLGADEGDMLFMITGNLSTSRNGRHGTQRGGDQEVQDKDSNVKKESTEEGVTKRSSTQQTGQSDDKFAALSLPRSTLATVSQSPITTRVMQEHGSDTSISSSKRSRDLTPLNDTTSDSPPFDVTSSDAVIDDTDADVQHASNDDPADSNQGRKARHSVAVKTEKYDSYGPYIIKQEYDKGSCSINCENAMSSPSAQPPRARVTVEDNQIPIARSTRQSLRMRKVKSDNVANGHSDEARTNVKDLTCGNAGKIPASKVTKPPFTEIKKSSEDEVIFVGKTESLARRTRSMSRYSNKPIDSCGDKPDKTSVLAYFEQNEHASAPFSNNGSVKSENPRVKRGPFLNSTHVSSTTSPRKRLRRTTPTASSQESDNHSTWSTTTFPVRRSLRQPILSQKALASSTISLDTNHSARLTDVSAHSEKNGENAIIVASTSGYEHDTPLSKTPSASDIVSPVKKRGRPPKRSTERNFTPHQASFPSQEHTSDSEVHSVRRPLRHSTPTPKVLASQSPIDEGIPPYPKISSKTPVKKRCRPRKIRPDENNSEVVDLTGTCSPQCTHKTFHDLLSSSEKTNETTTKSTLLSPKSSHRITEGSFVIVHRRTSPACNKQGGVARVVAVHCQDSTNSTTSLSYDVDYVVGGSEKGVDDEFVSIVLAIENPPEPTPNAKQIHSTVDNPNDAHRPRAKGAQSKDRADVHPPKLPPNPNDANRPRATVISTGTAQSKVRADVHPPKPPPNPNDANRPSATGISTGTAQSKVRADVHPPKPPPNPNDANRPSATGISTGTAQSIVHANAHPPPKPPPTEPKNYWRCHECGDLVSPATHCSTCRRPHKHQSYDEEGGNRQSALAIKKSFQAQVTRNALRRGRDFWMCSHCNIGIPSLSMPCGMCRRRFPRAVLEGKEFVDFIQMRRDRERTRREKVEHH